MEAYTPLLIVVVLTLIAFLIPAKYDPAIRLREKLERPYQEQKRRETERDV